MAFDPYRKSTPPPGSITPGSGGGSSTPAKPGAKKKKGLLGQLADMVKGAPSDIVRGVGALASEGQGRQGLLDRLVHPAKGERRTVPLLDSKERAESPVTMAVMPSKTIGFLNPTDLYDTARGDFSETALGKNIQKRGYLNTVLTVGADVGTLAGGVGATGKLLKVGKLAQAGKLEQIAGASSRAAGLSKVAKTEELAGASKVARAAGNTGKADDLLRAANQVDEASALRATVAQSGKAARIGNVITEKAGTVSRLGAGVADLPAKPWMVGASLLGKGASAGAKVLGKTEKGVQAVQRSGQLIERAGRTKTVADMYHKLVNAPTQEALYRHIEQGQSVADVADHLSTQFPKQASLFEKLKQNTVAAAPPVPGETPKQRSVRLRQFEKQTAATLQLGLREQAFKTFGVEAGTLINPASPRTLAEQVAEAGYVVWDPYTGRKMEGQYAEITPDVRVLPKEVYSSLKVYSLGSSGGTTLGLRVYDKVTGAWKNSVLALNPAWHYGNVLGNIVMAGLGAGLSPGDMLTHGRTAIRLAKAGEIPPEIASAGYRFTEKAVDVGATPKGVKQRALHPIQTSYAFNDAVDGIGRTMVYMAKKDKGFSSEAALKMSLNAMGDYARMNPFERNVVRRIVPFYAWQKHITKLAFRLPLEHPARVAWTLHLAEIGDELVPDPGAEGFDAGTLKVGGSRVGVSQLFPFGSPFLADPTVRGLGYQLNPLIKAAAVGGLGISPNKGFDKVSTPETEFGDKPSPLLQQDPVRFGEYLTQQVKQVRQAQDMVAGETKTRYETGQPHKRQKYADTAQDRWQQLLKMLGPNVKPDASAGTASGGASSVGTRSGGTASGTPGGTGFNPYRRTGG